jgi:hypothetical protein
MPITDPIAIAANPRIGWRNNSASMAIKGDRR